MHILFLIDWLIKRGGTEGHLYDLASGLADKGIKVSVFSFRDGEFSLKFKEHPLIYYRCLNSPSILTYRGFLGLFVLTKYVIKMRVDIVQSFHVASDLFSPLIGLLTLRKVVIISSRRDMGYIRSDRHIRFHKFLNCFVDMILANSQQVKLAIMAREKVDDEKIKVIYNGIHPLNMHEDTGKDQSIRQLGISQGSLVIGALGNVRPVKGFSDLVQAARKIVTRYDNVFFIIGGGGDHSEIKQLIENLDLTSRFFLLGHVSNVDAYLRSLDIYVQPSHSEGFSNAILEAMLAELPIIVSAVGGNLEIIEHRKNGLLFEPKCINSLVDSLMYIIDDIDSARKMGKLAKKKVIEGYLFDRMINDYINMYNNVSRK